MFTGVAWPRARLWMVMVWRPALLLDAGDSCRAGVPRVRNPTAAGRGLSPPEGNGRACAGNVVESSQAMKTKTGAFAWRHLPARPTTDLASTLPAPEPLAAPALPARPGRAA